MCQFFGFATALYIVWHLSNLEIFLKHLFNIPTLLVCVMEKELESKQKHSLSYLVQDVNELNKFLNDTT